MTPKTPPPKAAEPVTGTGRIRWTDDPSGQAMGYVGTLSPCVFRIWEPEDGDSEWPLTAAALPGEAGRWLHGPTPHDLKAEAERWLERFVSSLGAVFPEPAYDFSDEGGRPVEVIFAPGRRVRFAHPENGWPGDGEQAAAVLTLGEVYTIAWADIGFAKSRIGLAGVTQDRGQGFNSVLFEPVDDHEAAPAAGEDQAG